MRELAASMLSCSWALGLAGAEILGAAVAREDGGRPGAVLDAAARAAREGMGDVVGSAWESADQAGREALERLFDGELLGVGAELAGAAAGAARAALPDRTGRAALSELRDKVEAFWLVRSLHQRRIEGRDWAALVAAAYERPAYETLFEVEGLGHDLLDDRMDAEVSAGREPGPELAATLAALPPESLILLHAGAGMALAQRAVDPLGALGAEPPAAELDAALAGFLGDCRAMSLPGFAAAAIEPLGLVVQTFRPKLLAAVDRSLRRVEPEAAPLLWHGAGRAAYFLPVHFYPGATRRAAALCRRLAPDAASRLDALHGLAYAAAMVNLRRPDALEWLVLDGLSHDEDNEDAEEALTSGVVAALLVRRWTTPGDPAIDDLLGHRPRDRERAEAWSRLVAEPCARALATVLPGLAERRLLGELGRHRPLAALERMAAGEAAA